MPASQPLSYMEAIRIAEEREANVKQVFDKYDLDKSGTVDMEEMLSLLQDLGLLNRLKTDREKFAAEMFVEYDANDDGVLDFEEFKKLYNAAIDDSLERKRPNAGTRRAAAAWCPFRLHAFRLPLGALAPPQAERCHLQRTPPVGYTQTPTANGETRRTWPVNETRQRDEAIH